MTYKDLRRYYKKYLKEKNIDFKKLDFETLVHSNIEYYQIQRVFATDMLKDQDMLLFQWGTYDWGKGEYFQVDITRQVIVYDNMYQMSTTLYYHVDDAIDKDFSGNKWCSNLGEIDELMSFIADSNIENQVNILRFHKSEITFSQV